MGRKGCRGGRTQKNDTPVKSAIHPALGRRHKSRRVLPLKHYEAVPEETEMEIFFKPTRTVLTSSKFCATNGMDQAVTSAAFKTDHKVSSRQCTAVHKSPLENSAEKEQMATEEEQCLTGTPESTTSSTMESDTTIDFNTASSSTSSLPSPDTFRDESPVHTWTSLNDEEPLDLSYPIKNSTLLDVSYAEAIHKYHRPNISTIIEAPAFDAEMNCKDGKYSGPEAEPEKQAHSFKLENIPSVENQQVHKWKSLAMLTNKRFKKKVSFKSPIAAYQPKHVLLNKLNTYNTREWVQTSSPGKQIKANEETLQTGEIYAEDDTTNMKVTPKRHVKSSLKKVTFFDFPSDREQDLFFQRMRERSIKLRSLPLFPLTAPVRSKTSFV